jgi:hypothetical protein
MAGLDPATQGRVHYRLKANNENSKICGEAVRAPLGGRVKPGHDDCFCVGHQQS